MLTGTCVNQAQTSILAAAQINGIPTSVSVELGERARAEDVVRGVVRSQIFA